ncbi:MAG: Polyamine-transporting ATPase [Ilumatobacteraceae bacterium]|nr:Polyamine-transporting ATPase [Ilumatobacteraceae bacterium]
MSQYVLFFVLGLGTGAVYAGLSMGIVLTYQGAGVINFAAAAMATMALYVFNDLRAGRLTLPVPWLRSFAVGPLPTWMQIGVALLVAAALGALVELAVSRPLRSAPVVAKVVASIGVTTTLQAAAVLKYGSEPRLPDVVLPSGTVRIADFPVPVDRLWLIVVVVVLGSALALWARWSRTGLALRAAAENGPAASFARLSPSVLGIVTWMLSTVFSSFVFIVAGLATGVLSPGGLTLMVVPALAVALIARLHSLWAALIGALGLGALQAELVFMSSVKTWWPEWAKHGLQNAVPFIVIVVTLFVAGKSIPVRGEEIRSRLAPVFVPRNRPTTILVVVLLGFVAVVATSGSYRFGVITSLASALIALSLVVLTGMVGQISLAQTAFAGLAGLVLAKLGDAVPFPLSLVIAVAIATVVGTLVGVPALRIRGAQLAVVTLAAAVAVEELIFDGPTLLSSSKEIPVWHLFGIDLSVRRGRDVARLPFALSVLAIVVVVFVMVSNVMRAGTGRKMLAVRSNERAASSIGVAVSTIKLGAFALSSFLAGLGGALIAYSRGQLSSASFGVFVGLGFLAITYLSGITSASGAVVAGALVALGVVYTVLDRSFGVAAYYALISGPLLIITVILNPMGIAGRVRVILDRVRRRAPAPMPVRDHHVLVGRGSGAGPAAFDGAAVVRSAPSEVVLRIDSMSVSYGGLRAVDDVSLDVRAGEIVGLIGPNGAGKTSLIDGITGFYPATGTVSLGGASLERLAAHVRVRKGLARTWQSVELFDDLSVADNVRVSDDSGDDARKLLRDLVRPSRPSSPRVREAIELLGLDAVAHRKPSELSLGQQKLVGVARALALDPIALLLDEPAAGLDTAESAIFGEHLRRIASTGVACLLVDHDMRLVLGVCDRIYVIEFGRQIASGPPQIVRTDPAVVSAYLGTGHLAVGAASPAM